MNLIKFCTDQKVFSIHHSDLDGTASRIISEYYIKPVCNKYTCINVGDNKGELEPSVLEESDILIFVDIAPSLEVYEKLIAMGKTVFIYDHHVTTREALGERENYFYDLNRCGTRLFFEEITEGRRKKRIIVQFVELVDIYDLWKDKSLLWKDAKSLHNVLYSYARNVERGLPETVRHQNFVDVQLEKFDNDKKFYLNSYEKRSAIQSLVREREIFNEVKRKIEIRVDGEGNNYVYIEVPSKLSIIASNLLNEYGDKLTYVAAHCTYVNENDDPNIKTISFRCKEGFDVSKIAEKYDGGGHKQSAGGHLDIELFNKFRNGEINLI